MTPTPEPLSPTAVQAAVFAVNVALPDLSTTATPAERAVAVDVIRRRLRRELHAIALASERRLA